MYKLARTLTSSGNTVGFDDYEEYQTLLEMQICIEAINVF